MDRMPNRRSWRSFLVRQEKENPIRVADRFMAQYRLPSCGTYAQVATHFGTSRAAVCYHLALLTRLPASFVGWLRAQNDPNVFGHFAERQLRPITRVTDAGQQVELLRELVQEASLPPGCPRWNPDAETAGKYHSTVQGHRSTS
jgi:hypothetical protein